ncbi:aminotransferase [Streptomyces lydicamycinicus]|jgi:perosamine synthetase|uniref:Aminotransferase n=1 Tax=Streptomyces lydicamycinicus TaxID=1546107 RepID=A0A0P4RE50_9ACTN|nr:DegT/DnrJ/EryC1/StrS family aminotransferase [Streptomyces lydicamycinicus]GAO11391.1 aminotransferase [Streptomyces lydicamycinicus]
MLDKSYLVPWGKRGSLSTDTEAAVLAELVHESTPLPAGARRERFERSFAASVGSRHAISVNNGAVALQMAIRMLDLAPGDEVIATPQTHRSTVQPLLDYDVRVRFCDIDPTTLNLDPAALEALITPRTRALLLVHYGGCPAEMDTVMALARRHGFLVLEDCVHALGARYRGRSPGSLADLATFSLRNAKSSTALGEGGLITCDRDDWAERLHRLRAPDGDARAAHPQPEPAGLPGTAYATPLQRDCVRRPGSDATMPEVVAALGQAQLTGVETAVAQRRALAGRLDEVLTRYPFLTPQSAPAHSAHAYHLYTCLADHQELRDRLVLALDRRGVEIQLRYFPQHLLPQWRHRGHLRGECPVAERSWFEQHLNLPCHPMLTPHQQDYLIEALDGALAELNGGAPAPAGVPATVCGPR